MRILQINSVCGTGSTGKIAVDLYNVLKDNGHECKIAYGRGEARGISEEDTIKIGSKADVYIHAAFARLRDKSGFYSKSATKRFLKAVDEYKPDIIHLHNIHGYYINIELLFKYIKEKKIPVVWTLHDCWSFTGHSAYCDAVKCEKWMVGCYNCPQRKEYPKSYIDNSKANWRRKKHAFTDVPQMAIVTPSRWLAGLVKKSFLKEYPVEVVYNGIDTDKFYPLRNDFREHYKIGNRFMLLGVSSVWNDLKGFSDFIKLAKMLDDRFVIVMVGLNRKQIKSLPKNIIGIERTGSIKELSYIYSSADLFLNLTYCDNYPNVNIEAIACGTPVLTYETGGSPESAKEYGGYVVEQGDIDTVCRKVMQCMERGTTKLKLPKNKDVGNGRMMNSYMDKYVKMGGGYFLIKSQLGLAGRYVIFCAASLWDKRKGLDDLLKLGKRLSEDYKMVIIGLSEKQVRTLPQNIVGSTKINDAEKLRRLYAVADVFVNTTYEDNFPSVNIEALACGTPVITYNTGGCGEAIDEHSGITVTQGDTDAVIKNIDKTFDSGKCLNRGREFDKDERFKEYLGVYERLTNSV